jgi:hypothetical protein
LRLGGRSRRRNPAGDGAEKLASIEIGHDDSYPHGQGSRTDAASLRHLHHARMARGIEHMNSAAVSFAPRLGAGQAARLRELSFLAHESELSHTRLASPSALRSAILSSWSAPRGSGRFSPITKP